MVEQVVVVMTRAVVAWRAGVVACWFVWVMVTVALPAASRR